MHAHHRAPAAPEPSHISPAARTALSLLLEDPLIPLPLPPPWDLRTRSASFARPLAPCPAAVLDATQAATAAPIPLEDQKGLVRVTQRISGDLAGSAAD